MTTHSVNAVIIPTFSGFRAYIVEYPDLVVTAKNIPEVKKAVNRAVGFYLAESQSQAAMEVEVHFTINLN